MDIFRHRPLFLWCFSYTAAHAGGFLLFGTKWSDALSPVTVLWGAVSILCLLGIGVCLVRRWLRRARTSFAFLLALVLAVVGIFQSYTVYAGKQASRLQTLSGRPVTVSGMVLERRSGDSSFSAFSVKLYEVNGQRTAGMAVLTCYYNADLQSGDELRTALQAVPLSEAVGDSYSAAFLRGDGYVIGLSSEDEYDIEVTGHRSDDVQTRISALRRRLAMRLNDTVGAGASGLPSAFLLGDKSTLLLNVQRDFARSGVSHLLAISGLHMTLLFGMVAGILRLLGLSRRLRAFLCGAAAVGYLILLGFPPSATRAVVMLGCVYLSALLSVRADPLTALGVAGVLILAVSPYASADAGFWMSYLAALSLVAVMPPLNRKLTPKRAVTARLALRVRVRNNLIKIGVGLLVGVLAMSSTLTVVTAVLGETSLLSPLSTLILSPLCGAVLLLSLISLPLAYTSVSAAVGYLTREICTLMTEITARLSRPGWVVISLTHPLILPLAVMMLVAMVVLFAVPLREKHRARNMMVPLLAGWLAIGSVLLISAYTNRGQVALTYLQPSSQSDMLVLAEGGEAVICDFSNGSAASFAAAANEAASGGSTEITAVMLTHYHRHTASALQVLFARETVRALWVPYPENESDCEFLLLYAEQAESAGVPVMLYGTGEDLHVFGTGVLTLHTAFMERSSHPVLLLTWETDGETGGDAKMVYCGSSVSESDLAEEAAIRISSAETVIFGSHGPVPTEAFGADLHYRENARVIISQKGEILAYFQTDSLPASAHLWSGQGRYYLS